MAGLINFYKQPEGRTSVSSTSPVYVSHRFSLFINEESLVKGEQMKTTRINGIVDQLPEISYTTGWDISPISTVSKKIDDFTNNNLMRAIASNNKDFRPPVFTDGWTQKTVKNGSPLSVDISFRSYPLYAFSTTPYKDILNFMIYITTPREYNLQASLDVTRDALAKAEEYGKSIGATSEDLIKAFSSSDISIKDIANAILGNDTSKEGRKLYNAFNTLKTEIEKLDNMNDDNLNLGGAPLCMLEIGEMLRSDTSIKWLVKNWSFKPALNTTVIGGKVEPIYVDFKVSLETQQILTDADLSKIIIP